MSRIDQLMTMLRESPRDSFLKHALALEYIKQGDDKVARTLFEEILTDDPAYIGSYYHLGKLFERSGENNLAIQCYERGMEEAKKAKDIKAYNELQNAFEDLAY